MSVLPATNVSTGPVMDEEGGLEVTLDRAHSGLLGVPEEVGPVVGDVEAVRRHLEDADASQDGLEDRVGDPPTDRRQERPVA